MARSRVVVEVLEDLEFSYPESRNCRYVVPAGLRLLDGEAGCVLGVSGCGKSTVMTLLAALRPFERGRIRYSLSDRRVVEVSSENWSRKVGPKLWGQIGFAFQRPEMMRSLTAGANLELFSRDGGSPVLFTEKDWSRIVDSRVWQLSGGELQRLGLLRAFAKAPRLAFLDEPTNNLDRGNRKEVAEFLRQRRQGRALMVVSHDHSFVESLAVDRIFTMEERKESEIQIRTLRSSSQSTGIREAKARQPLETMPATAG